MTSISLFRPTVVDSLIPVRSASSGKREDPLTISNFKKAYTGVNCFLNWGEKISGPSAPFFSEHRQILKLQSSAFAVPGWFQKAFSLSKDVAGACSSKNSIERNRAFQKIALTSIDFTTASIDLVQCLDSVHLIDLKDMEPMLPRVLSGISCVARLFARINDVYQKFIKPYALSGQTESRGLSIRLKTDKEAPWKILEILRNILAFVGAVLGVIALFFSVNISPYVMLSFSTFAFVASLAADLHSNI
jgi:hypothetical protein